MSVERCIEALTQLEADLGRAAASAAKSGPHKLSRVDSLRDLVRDLTLNIDLRKDGEAGGLMTDIESDVYLPAIKQILSLLADALLPFADVGTIAAAQGLARGALSKACLQRG